MIATLCLCIAGVALGGILGIYVWDRVQRPWMHHHHADELSAREYTRRQQQYARTLFPPDDPS